MHQGAQHVVRVRYMLALVLTKESLSGMRI